jgi:ABC-type multidrug transport system fused ATPase/permease subunit
LQSISHRDHLVLIQERHQELIEQNGLYQKLYTMQFRDDSPTTDVLASV